MKVTIDMQISEKNSEEIEVVIKAPKLSEKIESIVEKIYDIGNTEIQTIVGRKENVVTLIETSHIVRFYSNNQNNYCETLEDIYKIKKRLYELEQNLDKTNFIRISHSCIVNMKYVKCFDLSMIGNVTVILKNGIREEVSKRRISYILKLLKEKEEK